ncbi:OmpA family protein [Flaviaesturariibacter flavus]|uniref:OmpA family protein n=1 Tax=Flaviaesturariibacter flavus TaxID=2502780 RepID=A0A4R1B7F4_9BACT|nr:OmpA family protein [Flaviaesturariibacter flavus]TCJ12185.1 OmpA family protein [Flaviaesturariibacter flavus]
MKRSLPLLHFLFFTIVCPILFFDSCLFAQKHENILSAGISLPKNFGNSYGINAAPGLSIWFVKGYTQHIDAGAKADFQFYSIGSNNSENLKKLGSAASIFTRFRVFQSEKKIQPYFSPAIGIQSFESLVKPQFSFAVGNQVRAGSFYLDVQGGVSLKNKLLPTLGFIRLSLGGVVGAGKKRTKSAQSLKLLDTDRDGVPDGDDLCPLVPGAISFKGCPDTDQDGVPDDKDRCPLQPGSVDRFGCPVPDTDGDGFNDDEDRCPTVSGSKEFSGCPVPDSDGDGLNDLQDSCILNAGPAGNNGCPIDRQRINAQLTGYASKIQFESGSAILDSTSLPTLNALADYLSQNSFISIVVEGHTDNIGSSAENLLLSEARASAVVDYLVAKGVFLQRLSSKGFGDTLPIGANTTPEGRARNRRVDVKLSN